MEAQRTKGIPWSEDEHHSFLLGLEHFGKGEWRSISRHFVITRTPSQVASHAQKFFKRQDAARNSAPNRRRRSIHDIPLPSQDPAYWKTVAVSPLVAGGAGRASMPPPPPPAAPARPTATAAGRAAAPVARLTPMEQVRSRLPQLDTLHTAAGPVSGPPPLPDAKDDSLTSKLRRQFESFVPMSTGTSPGSAASESFVFAPPSQLSSGAATAHPSPSMTRRNVPPPVEEVAHVLAALASQPAPPRW